MTRGEFTAHQIARREELVGLLQQAAELEHAVMCMYIFAAVTMKKRFDEGGVSWAELEKMRVWRAHMMTVAREEMEHLGLVINMFTAIGEAPVLRRRNFPFEVEFGGIADRLSLDPFSRDSVRQFTLLEMPEHLRPDSPAWKILGLKGHGEFPDRYDLIAKLYDAVEALFEELPEDLLFIGPPDAQFTTQDIFPGSIRGISLAGKPAYNVDLHAVTNRKSAVAAVKQIKEEGEGAKEEGGEGSHFAIFLEILAELERSGGPGFAPARPVVSNPSLEEGGGRVAVTHPVTRDVMALFDACYETLVLALIRYFAHTDESESDLAALQQASFFPMMTTVIRPLAECLTLLPVEEGGKETAGPSFTLPQDLSFLPHRDAAFRLLDQRYDGMVDLAKKLSDMGKDPRGYPELAPVGSRITQVYETLWRSRLNLRKNAGLETGHE